MYTIPEWTIAVGLHGLVRGSMSDLRKLSVSLAVVPCWQDCRENQIMADYDSPWKELLDVYFQPFMALCFPAIHDEVDWDRGYEPLDKELQKISPEGATGRRTVDKLLRVSLATGEEKWF
jgi:hypothetical protein